MKKLLLLFFLYSSYSGFSQKSVPDSLLNTLPQQHDTDKVKTLYKICAYYQNSNADSCTRYCGILYNLASKMHSVRWQANAVNEKGYVKLVFHDYPHAIIYLKEAVRLYQSANIKRGVGNAYLNLAMAYSDIGSYKEIIYIIFYNFEGFELKNSLISFKWRWRH